MQIIFKSTNNIDEKNEIKFTSKVQIFKYKNFDVYEFKEPTQNEMNRIEISKKKIIIIAGIATLEMELNKKINNLYKLKNGINLHLYSFLHKININKNKILFKYSLIEKNKTIGIYKIYLEIIK